MADLPCYNESGSDADAWGIRHVNDDGGEQSVPEDGQTTPILLRPSPQRGLSPAALLLIGTFAVAAVVFLLIGLTVSIVQRSGDSLTPSPPRAVPDTVVPAMKATVAPSPTTEERILAETAALTATSALASAQIVPGGYVEVYGTGELGLRLRSGPGLTFATSKIFDEGTRLRVAGGPERADEIDWWRLEASNGIIGWAAREFLRPVSDPQSNPSG